MFTIELTLNPVAPATMPEPLQDVLVVWAPDDGEEPVLVLAYIDNRNVWHWAPEGEIVQSPEHFTHWARQPVLPNDLVANTRSPIQDRSISHAH
ncbi:hypothetical protein [Methylobacillus flagellatus]|uniref:DUF551 domain-containing protein n=1 Tax=Methylobacillus flagellatus (strain ATCC 51484 / DSM 6875 / VKM B-1610 / KT) TaxID=265072 RepID=Q1GXQ6_METFK|nr:hypothetical protein [Methylobacillus flagellatus]ABE50981.1 hypothetical protein Mfla_2718 [Methylobacillus flagellatus KT]